MISKYTLIAYEYSRNMYLVASSQWNINCIPWLISLNVSVLFGHPSPLNSIAVTSPNRFSTFNVENKLLLYFCLCKGCTDVYANSCSLEFLHSIQLVFLSHKHLKVLGPNCGLFSLISQFSVVMSV